VQCTAKSKRTGQPCKRPAIVGKQVCYHHGGKSLAGIASPTIKSGKYSKALPARMLQTYQAASEDTELLALREEVQIVDARIVDVMGRVDTGEAGALWLKARAEALEVKKAMAVYDSVSQAEHLLDLIGILTQGVNDWRAWSEVLNLIERRRKLVESERKRMLEAQQYVAVERMLLLAQGLVDVVRANVTDRDTLSRIQAGFSLYLDRPEDARRS
jgi:hypothetical protein